MVILGVDPGTHYTGWLAWDTDSDTIVDNNLNINFMQGRPKCMGKDLNKNCLYIFESLITSNMDWVVGTAAIEMFAGYGRSVGKSTFEACKWVGRFEQLFDGYKIPVKMIYRKGDVCPWICKTTMAKDSDIRKALIKRYGKPGTKKAPGKLFGVTYDMWSALAIAVTCYEKYCEA